MRTRTIVMTVIGVTAVVGTAGFAAVIVHLNSAVRDLALHERRHLDPIAVPSSACPTLGLVRVTAARAGEGWWEQIDSHPPPWGDFAAQLAPELEQYAVLDGEQSLSDASDLVGGACGPPLYDSAAIREVHL